MSSMNIVSKIEASNKQRVRVIVGVTLLVSVLLVMCVIFLQLLLKNERLEIEGHITEVAKQSAIAANILINGDFQTLNLYAHILEQEPKYLDKAHVKNGLITVGMIMKLLCLT